MSATRLPVRRPPWARALHRWRRDREETQASLAARLDVSIAWLSHLETGYRRPSAETVERLRAVGFESALPVRHPVEVAVPEVRTVVEVDPDDQPIGSWSSKSGKNRPNAYLRDYSPDWKACLHEVRAATGTEAKRTAIREHLFNASCDQRDPHEVIGG